MPGEMELMESLERETHNNNGIRLRYTSFIPENNLYRFILILNEFPSTFKGYLEHYKSSSF